jgi:hypothetical protein
MTHYQLTLDSELLQRLFGENEQLALLASARHRRRHSTPIHLTLHRYMPVALLLALGAVHGRGVAVARASAGLLCRNALPTMNTRPLMPHFLNC